jgi:hypothetical protein
MVVLSLELYNYNYITLINLWNDFFLHFNYVLVKSEKKIKYKHYQSLISASLTFPDIYKKSNFTQYFDI